MRVYAGRAYRILDFDIENRPLSYWYDGQSTAEITSIAWSFLDSPFPPQCMLLRPSFTDAEHAAQMRGMLTAFRDMYDQADMVTGHYITRHDLPIINAAMVEWGLPLLGPKLAHDTKTALVRFSELPKTQENLADLMALFEDKVHMKQSMWRQANRLTVEGLAATEKRVVGDVRQHMELRAALLKRGLLKAPKVWAP